MTGTVKWFSEEKGYGFIAPDDPKEAGGDVFVHFRDVVRPYPSATQYLNQGDRVRFEVEQRERGPMARTVKVIPG